MSRFALNEVEATGKRAARGAGYGWGLAEEAAKATRWLCAQGLSGCAALAQVLQADLVQAAPVSAPHTQDWQGAAALCPLATGAALSDRAAMLRNGPLRLYDVEAPVMLLPFAGYVARQLGQCVELDFDGVTAATDGFRLNLSGPLPARAERVTLQTGISPGTARPLHDRATPDPQVWDILNQFAHRTYAPATEESRRLGAGAGLSDND